MPTCIQTPPSQDAEHQTESPIGGRERSSKNTPRNEVEEDGLLFSCRCDSARAVSTLLNCLSNSDKRKAQPVAIYASPTSLTCHVYGVTRQSHASVEMQAGLFCDYFVATSETTANEENGVDDQNGERDEEVVWQGGECCVNLTTVLECLHVLGTQNLDRTKLCLSYDQSTEIFKLELVEEGTGIISVAAIQGLAIAEDDSTGSVALAFSSSPTTARAIVSSEILREAIHELEGVAGATHCTVALSQDGLELVVAGHAGECLVSLSKTTNPEAFISVEVEKESQSHAYPIASFSSGMRGLDIAQETCLSMNQNGMIAIQHQVVDSVGTGRSNCIDFIMSCLEEEEEVEKDQRELQSSLTATQASQNSAPFSHSESQRTDYSEARCLQPNDWEDGSSDEQENREQTSSISNLFGTVAGVLPSKAARRRRRTIQRQDSDESEDLLRRERQQSESEDEDLPEASRPTTPRRKTTMDEYDGASSPEVIYGESR